jgi:hypothetical protein
MTIGEARELRGELEAVEAAMLRIKELWASPAFPCLAEVEELVGAVEGVAGSMQDVIERAGELPTTDQLSDLSEAVGGIQSAVNDVIEKAELLPTADDLRG